MSQLNPTLNDLAVLHNEKLAEYRNVATDLETLACAHHALMTGNALDDFHPDMCEALELIDGETPVSKIDKAKTPGKNSPRRFSKTELLAMTDEQAAVLTPYFKGRRTKWINEMNAAGGASSETEQPGTNDAPAPEPEVDLEAVIEKCRVAGKELARDFGMGPKMAEEMAKHGATKVIELTAETAPKMLTFIEELLEACRNPEQEEQEEDTETMFG